MSQGVENTELQVYSESLYNFSELALANHISKSTYLGHEYPYPKNPEASIFLDDIFWLSILFLIVPIITYLAYAWGKRNGKKVSPKERAIDLYGNSEKKNLGRSREDESTNSQDSDEDVSASKKKTRRDVFITDDKLIDQSQDNIKNLNKVECFSSESPDIAGTPNVNLIRESSHKDSPSTEFLLDQQMSSSEKSCNNELSCTGGIISLDQTVSLPYKPVRPSSKSITKPNEHEFSRIKEIVDPSMIVKEEGLYEVKVEKQDNGNYLVIEKTEIKTEIKNDLDFKQKYLMIQCAPKEESQSMTESVTSVTNENSQPITIFRHMDSSERQALSKTPMPMNNKANSLALVSVTRTMSDTTGNSSLFTPAVKINRNDLLFDEENNKIKEVEEFVDKISIPKNAESSRRSQISSTKSNTKSTTIIRPEEEKKLRIQRLIDEYDLPDETGKFNKIFKNADSIGSGSFGEVFKVKGSKID